MILEFTPLKQEPKNRVFNTEHKLIGNARLLNDFVWQPLRTPRCLCSASLHFISLPLFPELPEDVTPPFRDRGMFPPQVRLMEWVEAWLGVCACLLRMSWVREGGGEKRMVKPTPPPPPPTQSARCSNPRVPWLKITASWADILIQGYIWAVLVDKEPGRVTRHCGAAATYVTGSYVWIRSQQSLGTTTTATLWISHVSQRLQKSLVSATLSRTQLSASPSQPLQRPLQAEHTARLLSFTVSPLSTGSADILWHVSNNKNMFWAFPLHLDNS